MKVLLQKLLVNDDPIIKNAFDIFEEDRDGKSLMVVLRGIADPFLTGLMDDDDEEDEDDSEADEEEDVEKAAMESFVSEKFLAVTQSMDLTEREMLALRLAVVRDDVHLRAAIEVFRLEPDLEDLRDTLKRIARNIADEEEMG